MFNCNLTVDENKSPYIKLEIDDKRTFENMGGNTEFSMLHEEKGVQHYVLFKEIDKKADYYIKIEERFDDLLITITFDKLKENVVISRCNKNREFDKFIEAYHDENTGNITLEIISNCSQTKKLFYTFAFYKNEFSHIEKYIDRN